MDPDLFKKGDTVLSRDGLERGTVTGGQRKCQLDGCRGWQIGVRWSDKRVTWPCSDGLTMVVPESDVAREKLEKQERAVWKIK